MPLATLCTVAYCEEFLQQHRWSENWDALTDDEKSDVIVNASQVIITWAKFFDLENMPVEIKYVPTTSTDGSDVEVDVPEDTELVKYKTLIPEWLQQACCYEVIYFLDLDSDPARPFPLGILGLIKDGSDTFDHDYEPPLFSYMVRHLLENHGAEVDDPLHGNTWARRKFIDM